MLAVSIKVNALGVADAIDRDVEKLEQELAYRIVDEARTLIDESVPKGRIYRRGALKGRRTKQGIAAGLRASGKSRMITGSRFHRASAPGQPPAEDSGKTYREISVRRMKKGYYRVRFGGVAGYLEFGTSRMAPRPFIIPAIERAVRKTFRQ